VFIATTCLVGWLVGWLVGFLFWYWWLDPGLCTCRQAPETCRGKKTNMYTGKSRLWRTVVPNIKETRWITYNPERVFKWLSGESGRRHRLVRKPRRLTQLKRQRRRPRRPKKQNLPSSVLEEGCPEDSTEHPFRTRQYGPMHMVWGIIWRD
jgi:hypothetical protein